MSVPVLNLADARFECTFGRGCEGVCCRNGRPPLYPEEEAGITRILPVIMTELRPAAQKAVQKSGFVSARRKAGLPAVRVVEGWCIFFNRGCTLHRPIEGFRYKPSVCAMFPLAVDGRGRWYVRQKGYKGEAWDLFCLDPAGTTPTAAESLRDELILIEGWSGEQGR
jgi:Fe-S-cluster containining protein